MELATDDKLCSDIIKSVEEMDAAKLLRLAAFVAGIERARRDEAETPRR